MLELITGLPGHGKTLLAVETIFKNMGSDQMRPVFSNISGLDYDFLKCFDLDSVETWYELPPKSLIVIDECQRWFRPRPSGAAVPNYISQLETHRHLGHDIIFITQHPRLLDVHVRKLIERHRHVVRPFGSQYNKILEWQSCNEDPAPSTTDKDAQSTRHSFPKHLYSAYKSSQLHTVHKRLPIGKIAVLGSCLVAAPLLVFFALSSFIPDSKPVAEPVIEKPAVSPPRNSNPSAKSTYDQVLGENGEGSAFDPAIVNGERILRFNGFVQSMSGLRLYLRDLLTGDTYDLSDFQSYRKDGNEVVFQSGDRLYRCRSGQLVAILP